MSSTSSSMMSSFQLSEDIERDLAALDSGGPISAVATIPSATTALTSSSHQNGVYGTSSLIPRHTASTTARDQAIANPAAYAAAHFSSSSARPPLHSPHPIHIDPLNAQSNNGSATPSSASTPRGGISRTLRQHHPYSTPRPGRSLSSHNSSATPSPSGTPALLEHDEFYSADSAYFNLGGSSFPLLPHNSLYENELYGASTPVSIGGTGQEKAFTSSGRVHAQHFTSVINVVTHPSAAQSGFIANASSRAVSGATAYLPSLSSVWTFTTGVAPPAMITRADDQLASFSEDTNAVDPGPFILPPCPALDNIDMTLVHSEARRMKDLMITYARNHPETTIASKTAVLQEAKKQQQRNKHLRRNSSYPRIDENIEYGFASPATAASPGGFPSSSPSDRTSDEDAAALLALTRELNQCYDTIPPEYFKPEYSLSQQSFWMDEKELHFMAKPLVSSLMTTPGGQNDINPYASFTSLASYHASGQYHLPSIAEQKATQLKAYRASQERKAKITTVNEKHMALQSELSTYLDIIEQNLQSQISHKSWLFFNALTNIHGIQVEIKECLLKIKDIRSHITELRTSLSGAGLNVLSQLHTRKNIEDTIHILELMSTVMKTSPTVQMLLSTGDFTSSLQLIQSTRVILATELKGVHALKSIGLKLNEYALLIQSMMKLEFIGLSVRGGNFYVDSMHLPENIPRTDSLTTSAATSNGTKSRKVQLTPSRTLSEEEEDRLVPLVSHLVELGTFAGVFEEYIEQLKTLLKQRLMELVYELLGQVAAASGDTNSTHDEDESKSNGHESDDSSTHEMPAPSTVVVPPSPSTAPSTPSLAPAASTPPFRRAASVAMPVHSAPAASPANNLVPPAATPSPVLHPAPTPTNGPHASGTSTSPASTTSTSSNVTSSNGSTVISTRFASLQHDQFITLLQSLFASLMDHLHRVSSIRHLAVTCITNSTTLQKANQQTLITSTNDHVAELTEYVQNKIGKIISTRTQVHAALTRTQFRAYLDVVLAFITDGEKLASKTFYGLRGTLLVQAKSFLVVFHTRCTQALGSALELEKWVRVDVPVEYQALLDGHFLKKIEPVTLAPSSSASQSDPTTPSVADPFAESTEPKIDRSSSKLSTTPLPTWQNKSWTEADESNDEEAPNGTPALKSTDSTSSNSVATASSASASSKPVADVKRVLFVPRVSSTGAPTGAFMKFPVVHSLLVLLQLISEYVECSAQLQAVGSDLLNRLVELLQIFNSRSCQLVLGAGAMHLSGLKSITATHLALASQSVGLLVTQIPIIRAALASRLPAKHHLLLSSLDRVSRDCQEHQKEIFTKLIAIMSELIRGMSEKLDAASWTKPDAPPITATDAQLVEESVKLLMKQTCSLHRALSDLLLVEQRDAIFVDISHVFLNTLTTFANRIDRKKPNVNTKLATNIAHIVSRLRTCQGVDEKDMQQLTALAK